MAGSAKRYEYESCGQCRMAMPPPPNISQEWSVHLETWRYNHDRVAGSAFVHNYQKEISEG